MSAGGVDDRLLTFELGGALHAIPITCVTEVIEVREVAFVPTLHVAVGGVVNHHGDALPLVRPGAVLERPARSREAAAEPAPVRTEPSEQALVISERPTAQACVALPVDRVLGLVTHPAEPSGSARGGDVERCAIDGRLATLLDPQRLVARAAEAIERSAGKPPDGRGGER